jgi:anaerobic selenocysteine-containing dehydrogenase
MTWNPRSWVSLSPNGIGHQKPNHYGDMAKVAWKVKGNARKAYRILSKGVCDGCALGVAGFHDWTLDGVHLCMTRLKLLEVNCAQPLDHSLLGDVSALSELDTTALRELGRLAYPMRRRRGEPGFIRVTWDEALGAIADRISAAGGDRVAMFLTSRGVTNEVYYAAGKAARAMGVANIDSAARLCHAPSTVGLKKTIGVGSGDLQPPGRPRDGPRGAVGIERREQPAGVHQVPLPREAQRAKVVVVNPTSSPDSSATGCRATRSRRCSARRSATSTSRCGPRATSRSRTRS